MRFLFRLVLLGGVIVGGAYMLGYRWLDMPERLRAAGAGAGAAAGSLAKDIDRERIREAGSEIAGRIGEGAGRAEAALGEARLTAKIKAKIALDDTLETSRIDIATERTTVTVDGVVRSAAQRQRALQLARETAGVEDVVDSLVIEQE